jgi:MFS family permease
VTDAPTKLRETGFHWLWLSAFSYVLLSSAERFGLIWLVRKELGASQRAAGLVAFCLAIPMLFLVLPAGALADRVNRRRMLMTTQAIGAAITLLTALIIRSGRMTVPIAFAAAIALGINLSFGQPVRSSLVSAIVPRHLLMNAIVIMTIGLNLAQIVGPFIAGTLIDRFGIASSFLWEAALFVLGFVAIAPLAIPAIVRDASAPREPLLRSIRNGLSYVWHHPFLKPLFLLLMVGSVLMSGPATVLIPLTATDVFRRNARSASRLFMVMGVGTLCTSLLLLLIGTRIHRKGLAFIGVMTIGTVTQITMWGTPTYLSFALQLLVWGLCGGFFMNLNQTLAQANTPQHLMGRVMSLHVLFLSGLNGFGSLIAGGLAGAMDPRRAMGILGVAAFVTVVATLFRSPQLRGASV